MKKIIVYLLVLIISSQAHAQNFVPKFSTKSLNELNIPVTTTSAFEKQSANKPNSFADYQKLIEEQFGSLIADAQVGNPKDKVISFKDQGYLIKGFFSKGLPVSGSYLSIFNGITESDLRLRGIVYIDAVGACTVRGVRFNEDGSRTYGEFSVSNHFGFLSAKPKAANALKIEDKSILYHTGEYNICDVYNTCDVIVALGDETSTIAVDGESSGGPFDYLEVPVSNEAIFQIGYVNIVNLLLTAERDVRMVKNNGSVFCGHVRPFVSNQGTITFEQKDGNVTYSSGPITKLSVFSIDGYKARMTEYDTSKSPIAAETFYIHPEDVSESTWEIDKSWDLLPYLSKCVKVRRLYANGCSFDGKADITNINETKPGHLSYDMNMVTGTYGFADGASFSGTFVNGQVGKGVYFWSNGDSFEGDLTDGFFYGVPVNGKTVFRDGTTEEGNWLAGYNLSANSFNRVTSRRFPSAIRDAAEKAVRSEKFDDYMSSNTIYVSFFNPFKEYADDMAARYMSYDKKECTYYFSCYEDKIQLSFQLNENNKHISEAFYDDGVLLYITYLTWYSNGEIESIRVYDQKRKELYLSCNFFSDGTLRSAYKYGPGNGGKNILLRSKEAHPTYGGYTVKQYDLDGNYERTTKWEIGENDIGNLFVVRPMAPEIFDNSGWILRNTPNKFVNGFLPK